MKEYSNPVFQILCAASTEEVIRTSAIELLPSGNDENMEGEW